MRRALVLALLALALPIAAWASEINIVNKNGTCSISDAGIVCESSLIQFNNIKAGKNHSLGRVKFATGALSSGSIWTGGTFSDHHSYFDVIGTGYKGVPKGAIFTGAFVGPVMWTLVSQSGNGCPNAPCLYSFTLSGNISGQLWTGNTVNGSTTQSITAYYGQWQRDGKGDVHLGNTHFVTPEPGTLGLLGIGLVGMAGAVRRKLSA